jgi:homoserine O-succinyltransferase
MSAQPLRLCLIDMNNGVANEATRCFRRIFETFQKQVLAANPGLPITFRHVQPRNLGELPTDDMDLVLSSGGPGAPTDGYEDPWCTGYRRFLDQVVDASIQDPARAPAAFVVCHSFEITVQHFAVATMARRETLKFGVFPAYVTREGQNSVLFRPFDDGRLFTWEHRRFEAIDLDERRLAALGKEHSDAVANAYGPELLALMMKTLGDPARLARTYALAIPGWLAHRFNQLAQIRGLHPIAQPHQDMSLFEAQQATG